jgi:ABC-type nitrate/sulfonate/bicarbonate transport system ATPase subunit
MRDQRTVIFVTHDIIEACYLADRIIIYTPKPTRIASVIDVDLPRPRVYGSKELHDVEARVLAVFEQSLQQFMDTGESQAA